jgi:hypothetical protein
MAFRTVWWDNPVPAGQVFPVPVDPATALPVQATTQSGVLGLWGLAAADGAETARSMTVDAAMARVAWSALGAGSRRRRWVVKRMGTTFPILMLLNA